MKCINKTNGQTLAQTVEMKSTFLGRLIGLLGRKGLKEGCAIVLKPCAQIHTFFMLFAIDAVFISRDFEVLLVIENMKPWRVSPFLMKAVYTLEAAGGTLRNKVKVGDKITFEN